MKIETKTFGTVTTKWVKGDRSGSRILRVSADGQPETVASTRPTNDGSVVVELANRWTRPDGTTSPGFKISADQLRELHAERAATETDGPMPLGKTQLWEE